MSISRWALAGLLSLAALAGLTALLLQRAPDAGPPAEATPMAALPLALPQVTPQAASQAGLPALPAPAATGTKAGAAAALRIGSEGYGPHIERAQAGNDAAAAWEAVRWLRNCTSTEQRRNSFEQARNVGVSPEMMTQLMQEADAEARRCQTVTAQHQAMLPELAARAMRAGVPEAASAYAGAVFAGDLTPAQRQEVADAMRRDARTGDAQSLLGASVSNEAWGLSDAERLSYLYALGELPDQPGARAAAKALLEQGVIRFKVDPTPEQVAAAKAAAHLIAEQARSRAGRQP
jgi:hypothetical protein